MEPATIPTMAIVGRLLLVCWAPVALLAPADALGGVVVIPMTVVCCGFTGGEVGVGGGVDWLVGLTLLAASDGTEATELALALALSVDTDDAEVFDSDTGRLADGSGRPVCGIQLVSRPVATRKTFGRAAFPRESVSVTWTEVTSAGSSTFQRAALLFVLPMSCRTFPPIRTSSVALRV
jgi:hypothetical protein